MGSKQKKSTRNFKQKHLGREIERRRKHQALGSHNRNKSGAASAGAPADGDEHKDSKIEELDVDAFLDGDFLQGSGSDGEDLDSDGKDDLGGSDDDDEGVAMDDDDEAGAEEDEESSDDEDEDEDAGGMKKQTKKLKGEVSMHQSELEALKQKDPEFFKYLQENDANLLEFSGSEGEEEDDEDEGADEGEDAEEGGAKEKEGEKGLVTAAMVEGWCKSAKAQHTMGATRNLLRAYRAACHYGDSDESVTDEMNIGSSHVFNKLMLFVLREIDPIFRSMLGLPQRTPEEAGGGGKIIDPLKSSRWKKVEPLVKTYLGNSLHVLGQMTDGQMCAFTLRHLAHSMPLLVPFERISRKLLRLVMQLFSTGDGVLRVQAMLFIRQMALTLPSPCLDNCIKGVYKTFSANAKFVNPSAIPTIAFLGNCVVEIIGLDPAVSYQHAFVYIRQLAVLLRNALTMKTREAYKEVYCWQTLNCLEVWEKVLGAHQDKPELRPLVYPLSQVLCGAARLVPTPRYLPLRLRLVRALVRLGGRTGAFVPAAPFLLEMLGFAELTRAPSGGAGKPPDWECIYKVSKQDVKTTSFQEDVVHQVVELLSEYLSQHAFSIALPEMAHTTLVHLRRFVKSSPVERFRQHVRALVAAVEQQAAIVGQARDGVEFSPKDLPAGEDFMSQEKAAGKGPLVALARQLAARAEQRRLARSALELKRALAEAPLPGAKKKRAPNDEEEDEEEEEGSDGEEEGGAGVFGGDWMPSQAAKEKDDARRRTDDKKKATQWIKDDEAVDDIVEDLQLSDSDGEDEDEGAGAYGEEGYFVQDDGGAGKKKKGAGGGGRGGGGAGDKRKGTGGRGGRGGGAGRGGGRGGWGAGKRPRK